MTQFKLSWAEARDVFKTRTMWFVFFQGFAGVFPWNAITRFVFDYLAKERGYDEGSVLLTMGPVVLILATGYFVGGALGDWAFKPTRKGRILVSSSGRLETSFASPDPSPRPLCSMRGRPVPRQIPGKSSPSASAARWAGSRWAWRALRPQGGAGPRSCPPIRCLVTQAGLLAQLAERRV
jgi:hypothetical protein